jgi:hypothetical protein
MNTRNREQGSLFGAPGRKGWEEMSAAEEMDQFQLLEERVEKLIKMVISLKAEKDSLTEKARVQEERLNALSSQVEGLKSGREKARQRIVSLLEKLAKLEI